MTIGGGRGGDAYVPTTGSPDIGSHPSSVAEALTRGLADAALRNDLLRNGGTADAITSLISSVGPGQSLASVVTHAMMMMIPSFPDAVGLAPVLSERLASWERDRASLLSDPQTFRDTAQKLANEVLRALEAVRVAAPADLVRRNFADSMLSVVKRLAEDLRTAESNDAPLVRGIWMLEGQALAARNTLAPPTEQLGRWLMLDAGRITDAGVRGKLEMLAKEVDQIVAAKSGKKFANQLEHFANSMAAARDAIESLPTDVRSDTGARIGAIAKLLSRRFRFEVRS